MTATTSNTLLHKGLSSLGEAIELWESQSGLAMPYALIGDASGDKPLLADHVKIIAVARVTEADLRAQEPVHVGSTFAVDNPIDGVKEAMGIIGTIKEGLMELVVGEVEARKFFTGVGRVQDVRLFDCVGNEEVRVRAEEKRERKKAKKKRRKGKKVRAEVKEGGEDGEQDLETKEMSQGQ